MSDKTHGQGPQVHQFLSFVIEQDDDEAACRGQITHVGLTEVTASFRTTKGPFTATFEHDWLVPAETPHEWVARTRLSPAQ